MVKNLEKEFKKFVRKRNQKKRKLTIQTILVFLLVVNFISLLVHLILKIDFPLNIGGLALTSLLLSYSLFWPLFLLNLVIYLRNYQTNKKNNFDSLRLNFKYLQTNYLKTIKIRYILVVLILATLIIYQAYPSPIKTSLAENIAYLIHKPKPAMVESPWPWRGDRQIHPAITRITSKDEKSIKSVAQYIAEQETNPYLQVKAIHDYIITKVTYDLDVLTTGRRPAQDAKTVFFTHKGVCEGYANLFLALGKEIGLNVVYIKGKIRKDLAPLDLIPESFRLLKPNYDWTLHAWNAVEVEGNWYLVDTTWDDNNSNRYSADYLMIPAEAMITSHFPGIRGWQLLDDSKNFNSFEKQPILKPQFFVEKLKMISPIEYQTDVREAALIKIETPPKYLRKVGAFFTRRNESQFLLWNLPSSNKFTAKDVKTCKSLNQEEDQNQILCQFPEPGSYQVFMFSYDRKINSFRRRVNVIGQLKFTSDQKSS